MNLQQHTHTNTHTVHNSVGEAAAAAEEEEMEENSMMIKRGPWTQEEDGVLLQLVSHFGISNWVRISNSLKSRTPKQCRERYHQNLKPSLNKTPISDQEGARIEELVLHIGKKWAEIARIIGNGRSDNTIKNWWNGGQNKRKRRQIRQQQQLEKQQLAHVVQQVPHVPQMAQVAQVLPLPVAMPLGGQFALQQAHEEQVISRKNSYSYDYVSNNSSNASRRSSALFLDHPVAAKDSAGSTLGPAPVSSGSGVGHSMLNPIVNHTGFHSPSYGPSNRGSIGSLTTSISNTSNTSSGAGPTASSINNNIIINNNNTGASGTPVGGGSPAGNLTRSISSNSLMKWNFKFNNGGNAAAAQHDEPSVLFKQHYHMSGPGTHSQGEHGFVQGRRASSISLLLNASSKQQDSSHYSDDHLKRRLSKQLIPVNTQEVLHHYPQKPQHQHHLQQQQQQQQPLPPLQTLPQQQHVYGANGANSSSVPNLQGYISPPMRNNSWTSVHSPVSNASYPTSNMQYAPPPPQQQQQGQFAPVASPHMGLKMNYSLSFGQPGQTGGQSATTQASSSSLYATTNTPQSNTQGNAVVLPPIQNITAQQAASTSTVSQGPPASNY